jgi:predicted transcriptional regulator
MVSEPELSPEEREFRTALEHLCHLGLIEKTTKDGEEAWQLTPEGRITATLMFGVSN